MSKESKNNNSEENSLQNLRQVWAKNDIERSAEMSRKKLDRLIDEDHFEEDMGWYYGLSAVVVTEYVNR